MQFRSYRSKLQAAFLPLGIAAVGLAGWTTSELAETALRSAAQDRLIALREIRGRQIERYFRDIGKHVLALSSDESTISALEQFTAAWESLPAASDEQTRILRRQYDSAFSQVLAHEPSAARILQDWFPQDPQTRLLQSAFLAENSRPVNARFRAPAAPSLQPYSLVHARYHPTLRRYRNAFRIYDIFLIEPVKGRILYTVTKEADLGTSLADQPYSGTTLANAWRRAMALSEHTPFVVEDYSPYLPSYLAPAAFIAAPVYQAGKKIGVLAVQLSISEINRLMTSSRKWAQEGLGQTGQVYLVGSDGTLRSDLRQQMEQSEDFCARLQLAGAGSDTVNRIRRYRTAVLNLKARPGEPAPSASGTGTGAALDFRGVKVLRSEAPLDLPGLNWTVVAQIDADEAFASLTAVRQQMLWQVLLIALALAIAASLLLSWMTRPTVSLAPDARLSALRQRQQDLEVLTARLITAQDEERSRLARELHDDFTQRLAAIAIDAGRLERVTPGGDERWRAILGTIRHRIADLSKDIHGLSRRLHPSTLDDLGLVAALETECRHFSERGGPLIELVCDESARDLSKAAQVALYRIVQEALRNILKHSDADEVRIDLRRLDSEVHLTVADNGRGFDQNAPEWIGGTGLASMEKRVRMVGGTLSVQSTPDTGTKILVTLPA